MAHKFYISLTQVDHNPKAASLEITIKLFTDDLELALSPTNPGRMKLGTEKEIEGADSLVFDYLKKRLWYEVNGKPVNYRYIGRETENDVSWCYVEVLNVTQLNTLKVHNLLLTEAFPEQINLTNIKTGEGTKSVSLNKDNPEETVELSTGSQ